MPQGADGATTDASAIYMYIKWHSTDHMKPFVLNRINYVDRLSL